MSLGSSPADTIIVATFCKELYRKCKDAGGEYDEISREVRGLHTVLKHLKYEVEAPESPLNRDRTIWGRQLAPIISDCDFTLHQLDALIAKYGRLANSTSGSPTSPRALWDKVRFGSNEMDQLGAIRVKLISHKSSLTLFLDTIQLHQNGQLATTLDNHSGQLDMILDKVDGIAARMGQHNGSIMTTYDDDDKQVWKQFRRELIEEGFSSEVLQQHKDVLRAYIREIDQKGLLDEVAVDPQAPATKIGGVNPERWLETVQSNASDEVPPSFDSLNLGSDSSSKALATKEENMKFPTTMKLSQPNPSSRGNQPQREYLSANDLHFRRSSEGAPREAIPRIIAADDRENSHHRLGYLSDEDDDRSQLSLTGPFNSLIIRTSDLVASTQALMLPSPTSNRPRNGSFGRENTPRTIMPDVEYGTSPNWRDQVPDVVLQNMRAASDAGNTDFKLAPDQYGNDIPPDAKWTKVNRRLISTEVLDQDRRRYEARPDFVAILGVLSRAEIEDLAARTAEHRYARHMRHHPPPTLTPQPSEIPPQKPPRPNSTTVPLPIPVPIPMSSTRGKTPRMKREDTPSSTDYTASSDSDLESLHPNYRPRVRQAKPSYQGSDINIPVSGYPNPFGQPVPVAPPSPIMEHGRAYKSVNGNSTAFDGVPKSAPSAPAVKFSTSPTFYTHEPRHSGDRERNRSRDDGYRRDPPRKYREKEREREHEREHGERRDRDKDKDAQRDRERERRRESTRSGHDRERDRERERDRDRDADGKKRRWKENLTAAGIGGAAVSLFNVLSEAAEGL